MKDKLKSFLERIPVPLLFLALAGWFGYLYWDFYNSEESPLKQKEAEIQSIQGETARLNTKLRTLDTFRAQLDAKRTELRSLAQKLDETKASISDSFDDPAFMTAAVAEARRVGLTVERINPVGKGMPKEYYEEHTFEFSFKGIFVQVLVFLHRVSQMQMVVRVESFRIAPTGQRLSGFAQLEGILQIKGYNYLRSKADEISRTAPAGAAKPPGSGG